MCLREPLPGSLEKTEVAVRKIIYEGAAYALRNDTMIPRKALRKRCSWPKNISRK